MAQQVQEGSGTSRASNHPFHPHSTATQREMLAVLGLESLNDLFADIPDECRLARPLAAPGPLTEWQLERRVRELAGRNAHTHSHVCFLGGGVYDHHIPAVIDALVQRGEYLTSYTPYQPEMSQGLLQALFEFQLMFASLTGLPAVNCSVYDGATAVAEACWMLRSAKDCPRILLAASLWPQWQEVVQTYAYGRGLEVEWIPAEVGSGRIDLDALSEAMRKPFAGLVVQATNRWGVIEHLDELATACRSKDGLFAVAANPISLGLLEAPGRMGADLVCCEGQPLGIPLQAGGPSLGIIASRRDLERYLPGRIVGRVKDLRGQEAYALIKEDREQHVAREKATSHICSNQAHNTLRAAIFLSLMGRHGLGELAGLNAKKAHTLHRLITAIPGIRPYCSGEFFNEFVVALPCNAQTVQEELARHNVWVGRDSAHENLLSFAVTELRSLDELEHCAQLVGQAVAKVQALKGE